MALGHTQPPGVERIDDQLDGVVDDRWMESGGAVGPRKLDDGSEIAKRQAIEMGMRRIEGGRNGQQRVVHGNVYSDARLRGDVPHRALAG